MKILIPVILIAFLFSSCNKGIEPADHEKEGFSGIITFAGEWPDSVQRTHLVVFENPLNSAADFNILNLKYISDEIPFGSREFRYDTSVDSAIIPIGAGTYRYIAVAQSASPTVSLERKDWFVVGIYNTGNNSLPASLTIPQNTLVRDVNIDCDFQNLPPQPPGAHNE